MFNQFLLDFLCIGSIISGILVITTKNPVISVLFLISVFVHVAGYLCLLGVGFIGISYLIVYVGAIAILFLFVIIMLNLQLQEILSIGKEYTQNIPLGIIVGTLFVYFIDKYINFIDKSSTPFIEIYKGILSIINNTYITYNTNFIFESFNFTSPNNVDFIIHEINQVQTIGIILYTNGMSFLLICSSILLLAIIGPITLSSSKKSLKIN